MDVSKKQLGDIVYHGAVDSTVGIALAQVMKMAGVQPPALKPTVRDAGLTLLYGVAGELARQEAVNRKWIPETLSP